MSPQRVQLSRKKGWRLPEGAVVVARPTLWGNPWTVDFLIDNTDCVDAEDARAVAVVWYRQWLADPATESYRAHRAILLDRLHELTGRDLACWCPLVDEHGNPVPCHADVLLEIANAASE